MKPLKEVFESGQTILWIETQNTVAFLRPVPNILLWTPGPTAGLAQPLRFRQVRFTAPKGFLNALAIFDVGRDPIPLDDVSTFISERHSAVPLPAILPILAAGTHPLFLGPCGSQRSHPLCFRALQHNTFDYPLPPS